MALTAQEIQCKHMHRRDSLGAQTSFQSSEIHQRCHSQHQFTLWSLRHFFLTTNASTVLVYKHLYELFIL